MPLKNVVAVEYTENKMFSTRILVFFGLLVVGKVTDKD